MHVGTTAQAENHVLDPAPGPYHAERNNNGRRRKTTYIRAPLASREGSPNPAIAKLLHTVPPAQLKATGELLAQSYDHFLLLRAMVAGKAIWKPSPSGKVGFGDVIVAGLAHTTMLDGFGCPMLTGFVRSELETIGGGA